MGHIKKYLLVTLGFGLAGAIGAAFGTGTAQAVVASLVQVVNPATSPAFTVPVTDPGRIAYQSSVNNATCSGATCFFTFPSVPANHRVVVQHISGLVEGFSPVPTVLSFSVTASSGGFGYAFFPVSVQNTTSGIFASTNTAVLVYVDASQVPSVQVSALGNGGAFVPGGEDTVTLSGYELDCTVAACAPIATQ